MRRIQGDTVAVDLFGTGKHGFSEGDAEAQVPATILSAAWLNAVQEEIANVIESQGTPLDPADSGQLADVIEARARSLLEREGNVWTEENLFTGGVRIGGSGTLRSNTYQLRKKVLPVDALQVWLGTDNAMFLDELELRLWSGGVVGLPCIATLDLQGYLPRNATIEGVRVGVASSANVGSGGRIALQVYRVTHALTSGGPNSKGPTLSAQASATGDQVLSVELLAPPTDNSAIRVRILTSTSANSSNPDCIRWIEVSYSGWFPTEYL